MSDVAGIVLYSILKNPDEMLDVWPRLKLQYFNSNYSEIFASITKYYNKFNELPSFQSLEMTVRESNINKKIKALALLEVSDDIDINIAVEALLDQYTQEEVLRGLNTYVDKLPHYDSSESITKLSEFVIHLEEMVDHSEEVFLMDELFLMDEEQLHRRVPLGINNSFDARTGGMELTHLAMIGGHRGSGKSLTACNIACNQYKAGNVVVVFTIEMRANEIHQRIMSILSGVSNTAIKNQRCTIEELNSIANARKGFFVDSEEVYQDFLKHGDYKKFEIDLVKSKKLKEDNQIIIVDNPFMTLPDIDLNLSKFSSKYGDKFKMGIVDHVNEIVATDQYDWKSQKILSKQLKNFADKYDKLMVTPYQTDKTGEARFGKGLLDSADIAVNLVNNGDYITYTSTKTRGMPAFEFNSPVNWDSLEISVEDAIIEKPDNEAESEPARDVPPNKGN